VAEFDPLRQTLDSHPEPSTRDFIGLCIGILSVVLLILIIVICKWSRCACLKQNHHVHDQTEGLTSVIDQNTLAFRPSRQRRRDQNQRSSSCDHLGNAYPSTNRTRDVSLSSPQTNCNGYQPRDLKAPRVTITTLSIQPSQQLVPRLSISPQVSDSSIIHSTNSINQ